MRRKKTLNLRERPTGKAAAELARQRAGKLRVEIRLINLRYKREAADLWPIAEIRALWRVRVARMEAVIAKLDLPPAIKAQLERGFAEAVKGNDILDDPSPK